MPAPTGVSVIIDSGAPTTNVLAVTLTIAATGADEMAFSNNGVDFSPFEVFATSKSWNLNDFNGGFQEGLRLVTLKVRDTSDNAETTATDTIIFEVPTPRIVYNAQVPAQRTGTFLLDINYVGLEDSPASATNVTILTAEIDLTGAFTGSEVPLLEAVDDSLTDGRVGLLFSNSGEALVLVADLEKTFGGAVVTSDITKVRLGAQFGGKTGALAISALFTVNTTPAVVGTPTGRKTTFDEEIFLIGIFRDALGNLQDPDSLPSVTAITDPTGTNFLGSPIVATRVSLGVYRVGFTPTTSEPAGQWTYTYGATIDGVAISQKGNFQVVSPPEFTSPERDKTCIIFGDLFNIDGTPHATKPVVIEAHHLSEPEFQNPTSIAVEPITFNTDLNGHFEIEMIRNTEIIITIDSLNFRRFGKVPDQEIAEYLDIKLVLPAGVRDKFGNPV